MKKQEKLLGLYKELSYYVDKPIYTHDFQKIAQLKIKIKELEKKEIQEQEKKSR